jgi:hypothetical protein
MSIRNSWLYLTGAGFTPAAAFITALITACFTAVAFSIKGGLIKALACLVIAFSVFSTFSVYYSYYEKETAQAERQATERIDYDTKLGAAQAEIADIKERVGFLTEEAAYWRDKSWAYFDGFQKNIQTLYGREAELNDYILNASAPLETGIGAGTVFAAFDPIADFLGITTGFLRLIVFIIPAVFFDAASPLLFANFFRRRE